MGSLISPPAPMPSLGGGWPIGPYKAHSGISGTIRPADRRRGGKAAARSTAGFTRDPVLAATPRDRPHRSACDLPASDLPGETNSRAETPQEAPQQRLPRQGADAQEPLDILQPQACFARSLVELDPGRALVQQIGSRHDIPPRHRHVGPSQARPINDAAAAKSM